MVQIPVWPLPYWATACLLCLAYLPMGWVLQRMVKNMASDEMHVGKYVFCLYASVAVVVVAIAYSIHVPGFYFNLSLKDVQWAYLESK